MNPHYGGIMENIRRHRNIFRDDYYCPSDDVAALEKVYQSKVKQCMRFGRDIAALETKLAESERDNADRQACIDDLNEWLDSVITDRACLISTIDAMADELEGREERILDRLHNSVGVCTLCGKQHRGHGITALPDSIPAAVVLLAIGYK